MKRFPLLLFAGALMSVLCVAFVGCNEPVESEQPLMETEIQAVSLDNLSDEIVAFFDENAYLITKRGFEGIPSDYCVMINDIDELPKIELDNGNFLQFPAIDFDSYTLIIGQGEVPSSGFYCVSQSLIVEHDKAIMNVAMALKNPDEFHALCALPAPFWGLYPKIDASVPIKVNVTCR